VSVSVHVVLLVIVLLLRVPGLLFTPLTSFQDGFTPLHKAVMNVRDAAVRQLLRLGAKALLVDQVGQRGPSDRSQNKPPKVHLEVHP
jgi:hypothetical protein